MQRMNTDEISLQALLEKSRRQLTQPLTQTRRRLLLSVNLTYLCLVAIFLLSEKIATGNFFPHPILGLVYGFVGLTNLLSAISNYRFSVSRRNFGTYLAGINLTSEERWDAGLRWASVGSILIMSVCHMAGAGNPSSDALLTDFALGHSLIVLSAMLLGRTASLIWTLVVLGLLGYAVFVARGYSYQYNYLTPAESARYEAALAGKERWATARQAELHRNQLQPPTASRYFNIWLVFILVAFLTAYFCLDTTLAVFNVVPTVTNDIKNAIDESKRQEMGREREKRLAEEQQLLLKQESLHAELKNLKAQLNPHFLYNTLNYFYIKSSELSDDLAEAILKLSDIMRYSMQDVQAEVSLAEEINYLRQFIGLHQLRNENKLCIEFSVNGPVSEKRIIPFLFIGLIENSFKHGRMNDPANPLVIRIEASDEAITFYTKNLTNKKQRFESNRIGLSNLQRRLYLTYPDRYVFEVNQTDEEFSCYLSIQV
jgi:two-component system, LytTR family, sensor kinase